MLSFKQWVYWKKCVQGKKKLVKIKMLFDNSRVNLLNQNCWAPPKKSIKKKLDLVLSIFMNSRIIVNERKIQNGLFFH